MAKINEKIKSVRMKLFLTVCVVVVLIILLLVLINSVVLEKFYIYSKAQKVREIYNEINLFYDNPNNTEEDEKNLESKIKLMALKNNLEILLKTNDNVIIVSTNTEQLESISKINFCMEKEIDLTTKGKILYNTDTMVIKTKTEEKNNITYLALVAKLDNNYELCIRTPISAIKESVRVSNNVLLLIGGIAILIAGIVASIISKRFTKPILELNEIAEGMSNLDFSKKYRISEAEDEINNLGKSINKMSDKLESTINELKKYNSELAKDIEEKSKIDEMRKQFISDVSHELKTPIALIQGYAEGLVEDVNTDPDSRKYYAGVILDESNKMDKLVKQLLELMKIEYGALNLNNKKIDIVALIKEVIRKHNLIIEENKIQVEFDDAKSIDVFADDFYIEQVISNYITNAIKYSSEKNGIRKITINLEEHNNKVRVSIFNTGNNIKDEDLNKIWGRFYKADSSRNRETGGTGIGLAYVKAVMNNYHNDYGVFNRPDGVEFYFDCSKK